MRKAPQVVLYMGIAGVVLGLSKVHAVMHGYDYSESARFGYSLALIAVTSLIAYGVGLPDLATGLRECGFAAAKAVMLTTILVSIVELPLAEGILPRFVVLGSAAILFPLFWGTAVVASRSSGKDDRGDRMVLVTTPEHRDAVMRDLQVNPEREAAIVGTLTTKRAARQPRTLERLIAETRPTLVILDRAALSEEGILDVVSPAHLEGIKVRTMSVFYEQWLGKLTLAELERASLMFDIGELHKARYGRVKRISDIVLGLLGCVVLVVVLPFVLLGNAFANRGPLLYRQPRVGKNERIFEILKFRTMRVDGGTANEWTTEDDPRITPFGRYLRRTHIDELPQVINILKGDISLVGPRPEQPQYVSSLTEQLQFYPLRHVVSPGLTGWAQVKFGYAGTPEDAVEKLQYDFYYLLHQGVRLDLKILGRTLRSVLGLAGR